jgi:hypothetical protein
MLDGLARSLREGHPDWDVQLDEHAARLTVSGPAPAAGEEPPRVVLLREGDDVLVDGVWRVPVPEGREDKAHALLLDYVCDGIENDSWDVPVLLRGGPRDGERISKGRRDLVGRLLLARGGAGRAPAVAHVYKWHLERGEGGDYVCRYERTLQGEALDAFIARGVEETGPFVLIYDGSAR